MSLGAKRSRWRKKSRALARFKRSPKRGRSRRSRTCRSISDRLGSLREALSRPMRKLSPPAKIATARTAAPVFIPIMSGDTSGLFISDWNINPEEAKHIPAKMATTILGKRRELIIKSYSPFLSQSAVAIAFDAGIG